MFFHLAVRHMPSLRSRMRSLAISFLVFFPWMVQAGEGVDQALPEVVITATRTEQALQNLPIGATIITAADIQKSGARDANAAVRKLAGVVGRTDLLGGREESLDLRGYGATADQNLVVLIDGVRVSENEQVSARLSAVPVELIERIEIVRGGASVLWGEGASAGVINVVLKHPTAAPAYGGMSAALENFGGRDAKAFVASGAGPWAGDLHLRALDSQGFRRNGQYRQDSGSAGVQFQQGAWRANVRVQQESEGNGLPGPLSFAQFASDPRQSSTPEDHGNTSAQRYTGSLEYSAGPWTAQVDLAVRERSATAWYQAYAYMADTWSRSEQLTPRLIYRSTIGQVSGTTLVGLDRVRWTYRNSSSFMGERVRQLNQAAFANTDWTWPSQTRLTLGWRAEHVDKRVSDPVNFTSYDSSHSLSAHELGLDQAVMKGLDVYARWAASYRVPDVDDNRFLAQPLLPQHNRDRELGVKWRAGSSSAALRVFRQNTVDEIGFDPLAGPYGTGANVNFDPAQRKGVELEGRTQLLSALDVAVTWQQVQARFRSGPYAGLEQPLVAPRSATLRLGYALDAHQRIELGGQYLAAARFGNDQTNACTRRIPATILMDARYAWTSSAWEIALAATNLADRKTYSLAFDCSHGALYPESGRMIQLSVVRHF